MTTLSQAYKDNPLHLHHITPLDFDSVRSVPDSHEWTRSDNSPSPDSPTVPIIDLAGEDAAGQLVRACEAWGVFQVANHGISAALVEEVEAAARRLFSLPTHRKRKVLRGPGGATGYGAARISPFFDKKMWHEGFTIMGSAVDHAKELWPNDYQHFCDVMDEYQKKMKTLAYQLWLLILNSLGLSKEQAQWALSTYGPEGALQLNSYPPCPKPNRAMGLAPHTDSLFLTVLHQSNTSALQVFRDTHGWVPVNPVSGTLVVNVGDLLHILSNGRFPSVYHRVLANRREHRVSVAYFYGPPIECRIRPVCKPDERPVYRSLLVKEYIGLKAEYLDKALSLIRT